MMFDLLRVTCSLYFTVGFVLKQYKCIYNNPFEVLCNQCHCWAKNIFFLFKKRQYSLIFVKKRFEHTQQDSSAYSNRKKKFN